MISITGLVCLGLVAVFFFFLFFLLNKKIIKDAHDEKMQDALSHGDEIKRIEREKKEIEIENEKLESFINDYFFVRAPSPEDLKVTLMNIISDHAVAKKLPKNFLVFICEHTHSYDLFESLLQEDLQQTKFSITSLSPLAPEGLQQAESSPISLKDKEVLKLLQYRQKKIEKLLADLKEIRELREVRKNKTQPAEAVPNFGSGREGEFEEQNLGDGIVGKARVVEK